jgi:hypothetical protein
MLARRVLSLSVGALLLAGLTVACEPTLRQQSGVVVDVDSPALGRVDTFQLLTPEGEILEFDTTEMEFRAEFPASHLNEHKVLGDRIEVTFRLDGERRVVTQLDDRNH